MVTHNISENSIVLYQFQTAKIFETNNELGEDEIKNISCHFLDIATKENNSEFTKIESIHARNATPPEPPFTHYYPIASECYKRFIDGTSKFPFSDN